MKLNMEAFGQFGDVLLPDQVENLEQLIGSHGVSMVASQCAQTRRKFLESAIKALRGSNGPAICVVAPPGSFDAPQELLAPTQSGRGRLVNGLVFSMREDIDLIIVDPADAAEYPAIMLKAIEAGLCGYRTQVGVSAPNAAEALKIFCAVEGAYKADIICGFVTIEPFGRLELDKSSLAIDADPTLRAELEKRLGALATTARLRSAPDDGQRIGAVEVLRIPLETFRSDTPEAYDPAAAILEHIALAATRGAQGQIGIFEHASALCAAGMIDAREYLAVTVPGTFDLTAMHARLPGHLQHLKAGSRS